jgi:hypothetical protein
MATGRKKRGQRRQVMMALVRNREKKMKGRGRR